MAGICFFFEDYDTDVWSGKDLDAWNYACKVAGDIDSMIVINKTDQTIQSPNLSLDFSEVSTLEEAQALMGSNVMYLVCPWEAIPNKTPLTEADHLVDWYCFGPANGWTGNYALPNGAYLPQAGLGAVHSVHAATVVMFNRYWKLSQ